MFIEKKSLKLTNNLFQLLFSFSNFLGSVFIALLYNPVLLIYKNNKYFQSEFINEMHAFCMKINGNDFCCY